MPRDDEAPDSPPALPPGRRIGRFSVVTLLGHGGMGSIYSAYDDELERKVAIKVLHPSPDGDDDDQLRLRREAQAMARLSHPNVVTVHEVGECDDGVFVAMEFIRGQSLAVWLGSQPRWTDVLETFALAGRGLAAAHDAELVHRDFKPHNVMRLHDGRVKVLDFGLARTISEGSGEWESSSSPATADLSTTSSLTVAGAVMGTPSYMSPEQHRGEPADEHSDQYGFCVALWQGLTGTRPFHGVDLQMLYHMKAEGPPRWPDDAPPVPRAIVAALQRGLAPYPEDRWPSMHALLEVLTWNPERRRNRWLLGLAGLGALGMGSASLYSWNHVEAQRCSGAEERMVGVWDDARRTEVEQAFAAVDEPYTAVAWSRTQRELDAYANAWVSMHTETCEATTVRGEQSAQMLDLRMQCLDRAALQLQSTVDVLTDADQSIVLNAHRMTAKLRPLPWCEDRAMLESTAPPPPPEEARAVGEATSLVSKAYSLEVAGRYDVARQTLELAKDTLVGVDYAPVWAKLLRQEGAVLERLGKYDESAAALEEALNMASRSRQWEEMTASARTLMFVVGHHQARPDDALRHRPMLEGMSLGRPHLEAPLRDALSAVLAARGQYSEAEAELRAALPIKEEIFGPDHHEVASLRSNLGGILLYGGKPAEAVTELQAALEVRQREFGDHHPIVAESRGNLANALYSIGELERAEEQWRASLQLQEKLYGPVHPSIATGRNNFAVVLHALGKLDEAEAQHRSAIALREELFGPDHPATATAKGNLAIILLTRDRPGDAETLLREAIEALERTAGPEHPNLGAMRTNLGDALVALERWDEAETEYRRVLELREKLLAPDHPSLAMARTNLASLYLDLERPAEGLPLAEQAWVRRQQSDIPPRKRASTAFTLARLLWRSEGSARDRERARELGRAARDAYRDAGETQAERATEVQQWLDDPH